MTLGAPWRTVGHLVLVLLCLSMVVPLLVALGMAFKPANEVYALTPWPQVPTLDNFRRLFEKVPFHLYLWNSTATTVLRVGGQIVIAVLCAYAFARWEFPGREWLFGAVLGACGAATKATSRRPGKKVVQLSRCHLLCR